MRMHLLAGTALALALSSAAMADDRYDNHYGDRYDNRDHVNTSVTIGFGDVAFGYRDGYMDNQHRWHRWHHRGDYRDYRREHRDSYRDRYHNDGDLGITIGFNNIAFGYRDGYWDNGHRWHSWNNDRDYQSYRTRQGANFHDWNHDRDSDQGWQRR